MTTNQAIDGVQREFVREGRYIVVKPDYEDDLRTERLRNYIEEMCFRTPDCVVVEADWPEYEKVWGMIEARVTGRPTELDVAKATIDHLRHDLEGTRLLAADQLLKINRLQARISDLEAAQPQGEPVAFLSKGFTTLETVDGKYRIITQYKNRDDAWSDYIELCKAKQPAPVAVVMPERKARDGFGEFSPHSNGWNACLDELKRLNPTRPANANPPPGAEPSGTRHDNDGLDEMRKPICCGSCPGGCVIQSANK